MDRPKLGEPLAPARVLTDPDALLRFHAALFGPSTMSTPDPNTPPATPPAPAPTPGPPATPPADPAERTFTQSELNRIATREAEKGRRQLATELGLDPEALDPAAVKAALEAKAASDRAHESEAERKAREAGEAKVAADRDRAEAARILLDARRTTTLVSAGLALPADPTERAAALNQAAALLDIGPEDDHAAVEAAVDKLRARFPGLFSPTSSTPPRVPPAPSGGPSGTPPRTPIASTGDAFDRGKARAAALAGTPATST